MSKLKKKLKVSGTARNLVDQDFRELAELAKAMRKMKATVDRLPDDIAYTDEDLATLDEARHEAFKLAYNCEAAIKMFEGRHKEK